SVLAVRGRVGEPKPTAMIDLARPAYKLGITHIKVGWQSHTLKVDVASNKEVYKTRENSKIKVKVKPLKGKLPKDSDVAIAVVDEGLLDLKNNDTWDVLSKMMQTRSLEVNTASAQMQVVGRRHFGLKSLPNGGGGGSDRTRELFDTLLHWNPSVKLDKNGEAEIEFKTNDSLTSFKVVAIAVGGNNYFGHGSTSIRVTQDLLLFSGVPPVAREGDELFPELSLRNSSENPMVVKVEGLVEELNTTLPQNTITLEPGESKQVFWKLKVPNDLKELTYNFNAKSENFKDSLKITQQIIPAIPVTVQQGTIFQLEENYKTTIKFDENALPKRGGINLVFSNSLMNSMDGIKDYMSIYPYSCLEQQVSKSIILYDKKAWDVLMGKLPAYLDESGFAKYFPDMWKGEPILTSYILSIADERGWEIPDEQKSFMLGALVGFVEGRFIRNGVLPTADLLIRKLIALETLSRYGMAKKEQIATLKIIPNNLPVSALIDWWDILERVNDIPDRSKKLKSVENIIKSRLSMQGTVMKFTSESSDRLWWLMISPDQNAARLVLSLVNRGIWKKDMGRIIRGALSRQKRGRWDTTLANSWGLLAMEKFASKYEKEKVSGKTSATSGQITKSANWSKDPKGRETFFPKTNDEIPLTIDHSGKGKPWVTMQVKAAVKIKEGQTNGYTVEKEFIEVERKDKSKWSVGDIIKIKIKVKADVDMTWVVLNDPIPTGASILTGGLRRNESTSMNENYNYYSSFEERKFDSYRVYYEYAPEGEWKMEYTIRLNQDGNFSLPPTRIEAMYSPDLYGTTPNPDFKIIR
ncbi:MAG: hypothetical protein KDK36_15335, partial [Leptospiraceae bacterium]|nr:hypothetical protein [Leptospiraceae bacterium]